MASPALSGLTGSVTFDENLVNATPQLIDADVAFADADNNFNGGRLIVSGLLAEDRVSIRETPQVAILSGGAVWYDADGLGAGAPVQIGMATGGSGADFVVTFNGSATAAMIEIVLENLTYANVSDTPTASRDLRINVIDAAGDDLYPTPTFQQQTAGANPANGVGFIAAAPSLVDLDGDGKLDLVVGDYFGDVRFMRNTGTESAPAFTEVIGAGSPFDGLEFGDFASLAFGDLDGDGDFDAMVGNKAGTVTYLRNEGTATVAFFVQRGQMAGAPYANPELADLDGDGDLDMIVGVDGETSLRYYENTGSATTPNLVQRSAGLNPFNGIVLTAKGNYPAVGDIDRDGDLDVLVGEGQGGYLFLENVGAKTAPSFVLRTGAANPFNGVDLGNYSSPTFGDLDGDGDLDVISGNSGSLNYYRNTTVFTPVVVTVNVTPQAEGGPTPDPDTITGDGTDQTIGGLGGDDTLDGAGGDDLLNGGTGNDILIGEAGDDYLRGQGGDDVMRGGLGNDKYVVDSLDDEVDETGGDGVDVVHSSVDWTLGAGVENLVLAGPDRTLNGFGNELDNVITGHAFVNVLSGLDGADTLYGNGGDDELYGGSGVDSLFGGTQNDYLDGGAGDDVMTGGLGNDTYIIDTSGDEVVELAGQGIDTVVTARGSLDLADLSDHLEDGILTAAGSMAGNDLANVLTGSSGNDIIQGRAGKDTLIGGGGDDVLAGGAGADTLTGGTGADVFLFYAADLANDRITDLNFAEGDVIDLSGISQTLVFATKFSGVAGQYLLSYNATTGVTFVKFDFDGDGTMDAQFSANGDLRGTRENLYAGAGDTDGGWLF